MTKVGPNENFVNSSNYYLGIKYDNNLFSKHNVYKTLFFYNDSRDFTYVSKLPPSQSSIIGEFIRSNFCSIFSLWFLFWFKIKNRLVVSSILSLIAMLYLLSNSPLKVNLIDKDLSFCSKKYFFTIESIKICNHIFNDNLKNNLNFFTLSKLKYKRNPLFFKCILLLSGDISLNPGPTQSPPQLNSENWSHFKKRGLHFIHLNINSLLPKIDELRHIAKTSKVSVIGITETKLDESVLNSEVNIEGYNVLRLDRNRNGGGVACYIRNDISFNQLNIFPNEVENIFFDILLPNLHSITVGIFYRAPK